MIYNVYSMQLTSISSDQIFLPPDVRVVLLREHHPNPYTNHAAQRIFNAAVIQRHYKPGDIIIVEEDAAKPVEQLHLTQLPSLDRTSYKIAGWMNPEVAERIRALDRQESDLEYAESIVHHTSRSEETCMQAYKKLYDFTWKFRNHPEWRHVNWQDLQASSDATAFEKADRDLMANYELGKRCDYYNLSVDSFSAMQSFCIERIHHYHKEIPGRIFVVMGRDHGKRRHLTKLKVSYIAIDPFKQRAKINRITPSKIRNLFHSLIPWHKSS